MRRENRTTFNDDPPDLLNSMESTIDVLSIDRQAVTIQYVSTKPTELHAIVARARGLLQDEEEPKVHGVTTGVVASTYPRDIDIPRGRHDNDKLDISDIKIAPTVAEFQPYGVFALDKPGYTPFPQ